jgi:Tn3 transposase DDE domain
VNREAYMTTKIPGPKGEPVSLALAVHSALSNAMVPVGWMFHGDSETVKKMSFISQEVLKRTPREMLEHFVDRGPLIETFGALGLVVNAIILWNTIYMDAALKQLRKEGYAVRDEDVARLSPTGSGHINMLGRYSFFLSETIASGSLRPLRDPKHTTADVVSQEMLL